MRAYERFLRYIAYETTSDENSSACPSSPGQWELARALVEELKSLGLEDARVEVDGEDLFYLLQSYESKPANDTPEAHKKYVDIQFLISGREKMGVGALEDMKEEVEAHPERDIWFYHGPLDEITLGGDKFVVLFPGDAMPPTSRWTDLSLYASAW